MPLLLANHIYMNQHQKRIMNLICYTAMIHWGLLVRILGISFILNKEPFRKAKILIAGKNFGCGSSREHAPWSILDFGIKVIIAPSFADIFFNNSFKNGILPIKLDEKIINSLIDVSMKGEELEVDLIDQVITLHDRKIEFDVDPINKDCLVKGLDDIGSTLEKVSFIDEFEGELFDKRPWDIPS